MCTPNIEERGGLNDIGSVTILIIDSKNYQFNNNISNPRWIFISPLSSMLGVHIGNVKFRLSDLNTINWQY